MRASELDIDVDSLAGSAVWLSRPSWESVTWKIWATWIAGPVWPSWNRIFKSFTEWRRGPLKRSSIDLFENASDTLINKNHSCKRPARIGRYRRVAVSSYAAEFSQNTEEITYDFWCATVTALRWAHPRIRADLGAIRLISKIQTRKLREIQACSRFVYWAQAPPHQEC